VKEKIKQYSDSKILIYYPRISDVLEFLRLLNYLAYYAKLDDDIKLIVIKQLRLSQT